ncbi:hypothetical protein PV08_10757 [Exophiala spinifera]|uniref:NADH:ubiquinone oxidoreductase intermediate-associated protein 30 domain-containing protein n=1 Tax=Exophiala spinifera TaxID=91928 RepID=A0A0D1ZES6_9EURO|nr:uncharacterized protein PV08_10757 [Exophiala spinifera]KIW11457.1 hypothetical protein PV08_10757 [Exophiala spinifera]
MFTWAMIILLTGLVARVASASDQVPITENGGRRYNLTMNAPKRGVVNNIGQFDDIETDSSGIGFDPWTDPDPLHYRDVYFQSFKVVNVAKAFDSLPDPADLLCASSAPNALFSSRKPGYPWPRFSLHDLGRRYDPDDTGNATFNVRTVTLRPTGDVSVGDHDVFVSVQLNLMRLPTPRSSSSSSGFPGLFRGSPDVPRGSRVWRAALFLFGGGPMQSFKIDFERFAKIVPGFGRGVDTFEVFADFYIWDDDGGLWLPQGDWEVCVDDVELEMVKGGGQDDLGDDGREDDDELLFLTVDERGEVVAAVDNDDHHHRRHQEIGRRVVGRAKYQALQGSR